MGVLFLSAGVAHPDTLRLFDHSNLGQVVLTPRAVNISYSCDHPATPAVIEISAEMESDPQALAQFKRKKPDKKEIVVRRFGSNEADQKGPDENGIIASARFSKVYETSEQIDDQINLMTHGTLYFCDYRGFPAFRLADFTVSGDIGGFTVDHQFFFEAGDTGMKLRYSSWEDLTADGTAFVIPKGYDGQTKAIRSVGYAVLDFEGDSVPFMEKNGSVEIPVNLHFRFSFALPKGALPNDPWSCCPGYVVVFFWH